MFFFSSPHNSFLAVWVLPTPEHEQNKRVSAGGRTAVIKSVFVEHTTGFFQTTYCTAKAVCVLLNGPLIQ